MGHARSSVPRENVLHQDAAKVYQAECDIFDMVSIHWACPVALDLQGSEVFVEVLKVLGDPRRYLSLATALAVHGLARLVGDSAGGEAVDADLWSRHCSEGRVEDLGGHEELRSRDAATKGISGGS